MIRTAQTRGRRQRRVPEGAAEESDRSWISGDAAAAAKAFDRILAERPNHPKRAATAPAYMAHAKQLEGLKKWPEAAAAYAKAHGMAPTGENAKAALAGKHYSQGRALVTLSLRSWCWRWGCSSERATVLHHPLSTPPPPPHSPKTSLRFVRSFI